jgi:hypothetical protein
MKNFTYSTGSDIIIIIIIIIIVYSNLSDARW